MNKFGYLLQETIKPVSKSGGYSFKIIPVLPFKTHGTYWFMTKYGIIC